MGPSEFNRLMSAGFYSGEIGRTYSSRILAVLLSRYPHQELSLITRIIILATVTPYNDAYFSPLRTEVSSE